MSGGLGGSSLKDWKEIVVARLKKWVLAYLQMCGVVSIDNRAGLDG